MASAAWALRRGFSLRIADLHMMPRFKKYPAFAKIQRRNQVIDIHLGPHHLRDLEGVGWIIKNPDVPPEIPLVQAARKRRMLIVGY